MRAPWPVADPDAGATDSDVAALIESSGGAVDVRWDEASDQWLDWDGRRWRPVEALRVRESVKDWVEGEAARLAIDPDAPRGAATSLRRFLEIPRLARVRDSLRTRPGVCWWADAPGRLNDDGGHLTVAGGVISLATGEVLPHDRGRRWTRIVRHGGWEHGAMLRAASRDAEYDPDAARNAPRAWREFLTTTIPDAAVRDYVQLLLGAAMHGTMNPRMLAVIHGPGFSGKSTFIRTVAAALGGKGSGYVGMGDPRLICSARFLRDGPSFHHMMVYWSGRRIVILDDMYGRRLNVGMLKYLLRNDSVMSFNRNPSRGGVGSVMHKSAWTLFAVASHLPIVARADAGIWGEIVVIPFPNVVPEGKESDALKVHLSSDPDVLRHVLAWVVEGAVRWARDPAALRRFPPAVKRATDAWRLRAERRGHPPPVEGPTLQSRCEAWLASYGYDDPERRYEVVEQDGASAMASALYEAYLEWCKSTRTVAPMSERGLGFALRKAGYRRERVRSGSEWHGLRVIDAGGAGGAGGAVPAA